MTDRVTFCKCGFTDPDGTFVPGEACPLHPNVKPQREARTSKPKSYVQYVPGHCDRIVWRGSYYMLPLPSAPSPVETKAEPQVGDEIVLNFTSSLVKSRTGWKIDRIDRTEYFFVSDSNGSVLTLLRGQFACSSVELRVLCICPPGVSRIDCPACGNDAHRLSPPPPDPIVGENEDMGSAAPPPLKASAPPEIVHGADGDTAIEAK